MYQNNGAWLNDAKTQSVINSPQNRATLTTYIGWIKSGLAQTPAQLGVGWCGEAIGKEKAAIVFEGNWIYGYLQKDFPSVRFGVYPMITQQGAREPRRSRSRTRSARHRRTSRPRGDCCASSSASRGRRSGRRTPASCRPGATSTPPAGRANFIRQAPYARPWQFTKGFQRVIDAAAKELGQDVQRRPDGRDDAREHRPRDEGRDRVSGPRRRRRPGERSGTGVSPDRVEGGMAVEARRSRRLPSVGGDRRARGGRRATRSSSIPLFVFGLFQLYPMVYAFYVSAHEWGGIEGNLGYVGLDNYRELWHDDGVLDLAAGARSRALEHVLLRGARRSAADDARADDGAHRQPGDPWADLLPLRLLLSVARLLGCDLGDRDLPPERRRARRTRPSAPSSAGSSTIRGSAMQTPRSSRSSSSMPGRRRGR